MREKKIKKKGDNGETSLQERGKAVRNRIRKRERPTNFPGKGASGAATERKETHFQAQQFDHMGGGERDDNERVPDMT